MLIHSRCVALGKTGISLLRPVLFSLHKLGYICYVVEGLLLCVVVLVLFVRSYQTFPPVLYPNPIVNLLTLVSLSTYA